MPLVFVPPSMRSVTEGQTEVQVDGATVGQVIDNLESRFPGIKERLCQQGRLRPGLSVAVGGSIAALGLLEKAKPDDEIHFLPTIGGG